MSWEFKATVGILQRVASYFKWQMIWNIWIMADYISFVSQDKNFAPRFAGLYIRGANGLLKIQYKESLADGLYFETLRSPNVWTKALNSDVLKGDFFFSGANMSLWPGSTRNPLVHYKWSEHIFGYRPQRRPPLHLPSGRIFLNPNSNEYGTYVHIPLLMVHLRTASF